MEAITYIIPGQIAYMSIPASTLRHFVDGAFPYFAKFPSADIIAGASHRYKAGHDILLDVPATFFRDGIVDSYKHLGHILLTDFPTKAGIPFPGFSHSGLGNWLESVGISRGWMNVNICDGGFGLLAIGEGQSDILQALDGTLHMDAGTFFDTFGEGATELLISIPSGNGLLTLAGIQNILAGLISAWNTVVVHVDPIAFFGSALFSAIMGFSISQLIVKREISSSALNALRAALVGGLFAVFPPFGFGAIGGLLAYQAGVKFGEYQNRQVESYLAIDRGGLRLFLEELVKGNPNFMDFLKLTEFISLPTDFGGFCTIPIDTLVSTREPLPLDYNKLLEAMEFENGLSTELDYFGKLMKGL